MVPADEDTKSTKSLTTKGSSSSSKSKSNDMGKMFLSIKNTFKTMGKAMSQVSKEIAAYGDEDSIGAQSHALAGFIKNNLSSYAFANGPAKVNKFLLLVCQQYQGCRKRAVTPEQWWHSTYQEYHRF